MFNWIVKLRRFVLFQNNLCQLTKIFFEKTTPENRRTFIQNYDDDDDIITAVVVVVVVVVVVAAAATATATILILIAFLLAALQGGPVI